MTEISLRLIHTPPVVYTKHTSEWWRKKLKALYAEHGKFLNLDIHTSELGSFEMDCSGFSITRSP